jgi:Transposase
MNSIIAQNALDTPPHTPPLLRQGTAHLTRDQRRDIRLMHDLHHSDAEIIQRFTITQRQLDYTIQAGRPTPRKPPGRHCKLKDPQIDILIAYMISSAHTRRMTFKALAKDPHLNLQCSVNAIKNALHKRGYHRRLARHKPPISEKNRVLRLEFAHESEK